MNKFFNFREKIKKLENWETQYRGARSPGVLYASVLGARQFGNFTFTTLLLIGGIGFQFAGLITYITLPKYVQEINFLPQGILLVFYGTLALTLGLFSCLILYWNIGAGYNEINKMEQLIRLQRNGYPGNNQRVLLTYEINEVIALEIKITEGINPTQVMYICLKNERKIPLIFTNQVTSLMKIEEKATLLSKFLEVPLKIKTATVV